MKKITKKEQSSIDETNEILTDPNILCDIAKALKNYKEGKFVELK